MFHDESFLSDRIVFFFPYVTFFEVYIYMCVCVCMTERVGERKKANDDVLLLRGKMTKSSDVFSKRKKKESFICSYRVKKTFHFLF